MKSKNYQFPYFILLGVLIQLLLTVTLFDNWAVTILSSTFSIFILGLSIVNTTQQNQLINKERSQLNVDLDLLRNEIERLQQFNKQHLTTIRKLKAYARSAVKRLNGNQIDFLNTAENMDNPVVLLKNDGVVKWLNKAAEDLYGFSKGALQGSSISDLLVFEEEKSFEDLINKIKKGSTEFEFQIRKGSGNKTLTHSHFSFIKDRDQKITGVVVVQMNISDIRANENQLKESLERAQFAEKELKQFIDKQLETNEQLMRAESQLRVFLDKEKESKAVLNQTLNALKDTQGQLVHSEKMASLGQLTAGIAHEINNPINFIYNGIDTLKRSLNDLALILDAYSELDRNNDLEVIKRVNELKAEFEYDLLREDLDEMVVDIKEGAIRTIEIVKGLRVFSRLDEEEQKKADINECLDATIVLLQNKLKNKVELIRKFETDLPDILCYPGQLNQVFMNIISNAIQAFEDDQNNCAITVSTFCDEDNIIVSIKDNGIGMSEETQNRIFEPFFTTKPVGVGTGLGLSISFGIIEKHKGHINLQSTVGVGTEFIITIPKKTELENVIATKHIA